MPDMSMQLTKKPTTPRRKRRGGGGGDSWDSSEGWAILRCGECGTESKVWFGIKIPTGWILVPRPAPDNVATGQCLTCRIVEADKKEQMQ
jgi:hypothetical protein